MNWKDLTGSGRVVIKVRIFLDDQCPGSESKRTHYEYMPGALPFDQFVR
jgi:hypothetical protein